MKTESEIIDIMEKIIANLTPDLLLSKYRNYDVDNHFEGHCYVASEAFYHLVGGKKAGFVPMCIKINGQTHWYIHDKISGCSYDLTLPQFKKIKSISEPIPKGFLTKGPSKRAKILMQRVLNG